MTTYQDFVKGKALARVDGGIAGVYYCETRQEFEDAVYRIVMHSTGDGLYEVEFMELTNGN